MQGEAEKARVSLMMDVPEESTVDARNPSARGVRVSLTMDVVSRFRKA